MCGGNVFFSLADFKTYPVTDAGLFYDSCEFSYIETDADNLNGLLKLGDIFVFEPTGAYSWVWHNNLLSAGKEVRLLPHRKTKVYRELCGWNYKDDEHDAVALAYYGWLNLDNLKAFNWVRTPELHAIYRNFLTKEQLVKELRVLLNRARNLLHHEFPEAKNSKEENSKKAHNVWLFVANQEMNRGKRTGWEKKLSLSIGTAKEEGFSEALVSKARRIVELQQARSRIKADFEEFLLKPEYQWCVEVFRRYWLSTFEQVILLCQINPFEQFLDENLKELRIEKKRKLGKSGKPITKRVGLNKFHSRVGKAVYPWSSGDKEGHIVSGSKLARNHLYLWVNRNIVMRKIETDPDWLLEMREDYHRDKGDCSKLMDELKSLGDHNMTQLSELLEPLPAGRILLSLIEEALAKQKSPTQVVKSRGKSCLKQWAKSRVSDRLVKLLFKELIGAYRRR